MHRSLGEGVHTKYRRKLRQGDVKSPFAKAAEDNGGLAQLARAPALHAGGHRFDSDILHTCQIPSFSDRRKFFDILERRFFN